MAASEKQVDECSRRFVGWLRWYMVTHPKQIPTQKALAKALGVTDGAISQVFGSAGPRPPTLRLLLGAHQLIGASVDSLLFTEPPAIPQ